MSDTIITVENLSKSYLVGHKSGFQSRSSYTALRDVIGREVRNVARNALNLVRGRQVVQGDAIEEFWALKNVSFEVKRGEVLGIIGRNGAGKSTLLKILSRITEPTQGRVLLRGRVASLLEVGTGFHPELTGRENIYLNGAILGMTRAEIKHKFDEIVDFAEVETFLDTPVKRYSSGMYVRLAFAVAAHLEPEILVVDEVLAVGDAEFQKKCLGKIDEVSRREGRTVLFVSHNMGVVISVCQRVIWLNHGSAVRDGSARAVIDDYLQHEAPNRNSMVEMGSNVRPSLVHDQRLRLHSLEWLSDLPLRHGEPVKARIHFKTYASVPSVSIGIGFCARESARLLTYYTDFQDGFRPDLAPGDHSVEVAIDALPLGPQIYEFEVGCRSGDFHVLDYLPACSLLEVVAGPKTPGYIIVKDTGVRLSSEWSWDSDGQSLEMRTFDETMTALSHGVAHELYDESILFRNGVRSRTRVNMICSSSVKTRQLETDTQGLGATRALRARAIALYLPQFHPVPENDEWWGKGFTEWTNTAKARPMFPGHYQPHIPTDLGFYDLRVPETREAQAALAHRYGIEGFCYYHYWFAGRRILERPFNEVLHSGTPDFPFCLCWANETWSGIWHGSPNQILIEQTYPGQADHEAHFRALLPAFADRRYIRLGGKPVFLIYRPTKLPDAAATLALWQAMAVNAGLGGLHIAGVSYSLNANLSALGFDSEVIEPGLAIRQRVSRRHPLKWVRSKLEIRRGLPTIESYRSFSERQMSLMATGDAWYPCLTHAWDNTPRSGRNGVVLVHATPDSFRKVLDTAVHTLEKRPLDQRLLFLKSWNEWGEGNHLEPDIRFGTAFLQAVADALGAR